jgi:hypothetical protein
MTSGTLNIEPPTFMLLIPHKKLHIMDKHDFAIPARRPNEPSSIFRRIIIAFLVVASLHMIFRHSYVTDEVNQVKKSKPFDWFDVRWTRIRTIIEAHEVRLNPAQRSTSRTVTIRLNVPG